MRFTSFVAAALLSAAPAASPVSAAPISGTYAFTVSGFTPFPVSTVPSGPISGRFETAFDNAAQGSVPIPINNLETSISPVSSYSGQYLNGNLFPIGSQPEDEIFLTVLSGSNSFVLGVRHASTAPAVLEAIFAVSDGGFNGGSFSQGSVSFTPATTAVAEPMSVALLSTTLAGLGLIRLLMKRWWTA